MEAERTPKRELLDMNLKEGSFVTEGDNPEAHILLTKGKKSFLRKVMDWVAGEKNAEVLDSEKFMSTSEILAEDEFQHDFNKLRNAFFFSVDWALSMPSDEIPALLDKSVKEFSQEMQSLIVKLEGDSPDTAQEMGDMISKLQAISVTNTEEREQFAESLKHFDVLKMPKVKTKTVADATNKEGVMPNAEKSLEDVLKGLPEAEQNVVKSAMEATEKAKAELEEVKAEAEKVKAEAEAATEANKTLSTRLDALEARESRAEYVAKAREIGSGDIEETASALQAAYSVDKSTGETIEKALRSAAAIADKSSLFEEVGKSGAGVSDDSAEGKLNKLVAEKVKSGVPENKAYTAVVQENPKLAMEAING